MKQCSQPDECSTSTEDRLTVYVPLIAGGAGAVEAGELVGAAAVHGVHGVHGVVVVAVKLSLPSRDAGVVRTRLDV